MSDHDALDETLLVATALSQPNLTYAALYSPSREFLISVLPISLVAFGLALWLLYRSGASPTLLAPLGALVDALGWLRWVAVLAALVYPFYKIWQAAADDSSTKITHHLFTKDGIELISGSGSSVLRWSDLSRVTETNKGFLFYQGRDVATFVRRRCLEGDAEVAIVRKFIRANVASANLLA